MKKYRKLILGLGLIICLTGCKESVKEQDEPALGVDVESINESSTEEKAVDGNSTDDYDKFLAGEISAVGVFEGSEYEIWFNELPQDPEEWDSYSVSDEKVDLDNDGEDELILNGPYGGMYIDARDGGVYVLAQGEGTAGELGYVVYEGKTYITHRDVSHGGRQVYWFDQYNGTGEVVDSFELSAEYCTIENAQYDSDSDFTFRGEKITMDEYESLLKEIFE